MKALVLAVMLAFASVAVSAADAPKKDEKKAVETNCVKKDKNGKCPPPPKSEKPTPKKKVEEKK
jgi:hypothetical protein